VAARTPVFLKLYSDSRSRILAAVGGFLTKNPSVTTIYAVGHSLGAAVAVIAGLDLANVYVARSSIKIKVVGWGVPRVGDKTFASKFGAFPSLSVTRYRQWRKILLVVKEWDPVSLIPLEMQGFEHVGTEVAIECKTCNSWIEVHRMQNYIASFARLGRALASC
jgi:hypothetical protein